jgi:hypothetical protein
VTAALAERITDALADAISAGELGACAGMPGGWLLVGTVFNTDGRPSDFVVTATGVTSRDALGLLGVAEIVVSPQVEAVHIE